MRYSLQVRTQSKKPRVENQGGIIKVYVSAPAREGKANIEVVDRLAKYFSVPKSLVKILKGANSKNKLVEIG